MNFFSSRKIAKNAYDGDDERPSRSASVRIGIGRSERRQQREDDHYEARERRSENRYDRDYYERAGRDSQRQATGSRSYRAGAPSLSPDRAAYENQRRTNTYRRRSPVEDRRSRSPARASTRRIGIFGSGRRPASPETRYRSRQQDRRNDNDLAERLAGFSMRENPRGYSTKVDRIYEVHSDEEYYRR